MNTTGRRCGAGVQLFGSSLNLSTSFLGIRILYGGSGIGMRASLFIARLTSSVDESVCEIPDSLSDTIKPVLEFITEQQVVPENLSPDHVDAVRNFKAETQRTKRLSQNAIQCLISALLTIGLFVLGQILTSQDSAHTSQQLDRQIAISEEQLEQSKLTNELLEEHIRLLQSIDDSIDQLMEARDIPVQDVHPSNETQYHPTE